MIRNRIIGAVMVFVGAALVWQGWQAKQPIGARISQALMGAQSSAPMWMLAGGAILAVLGAVLIARR